MTSSPRRVVPQPCRNVPSQEPRPHRTHLTRKGGSRNRRTNLVTRALAEPTTFFVLCTRRCRGGGGFATGRGGRAGLLFDRLEHAGQCAARALEGRGQLAS